MAIKKGKARTFDADELRVLLDEVEEKQASKKNASPPEIMRAAFMLAFYAGLRVQEIAGLEWDVHIFDGKDKHGKPRFRTSPAPVFDADGNVMKHDGDILMRNTPSIEITAAIGKYGKARMIPMHPDLIRALKNLHALGIEGPYVIPSVKTGAAQGLKARAHALKMRINRMYKALDIERGSTHSGRRSFATRAARRAEAFDNSLLDVRDLLGHSSIATTQKYVDPSPRQADLVEALW